MTSFDGVQTASLTTVQADVLTLCINRNFDSGMLQQDWASKHLARFPGPYRAVRIDLSAAPRLSSLFFAGLMQLHFAYTGQGLARLTLVKTDPRTATNLKVLRLDQHFGFET